MELTGERLIPAPIEATWAALNDPDVLKACVNGCETLERTGDDAFAAVVKLKVGPVSARFKGNLKLSDVNPPTSYTIHFDGQGGIAGFGKGSADVLLAPDGAATRLSYNARAQVGGKMAQIGSRLIDAAAGKITEDFFKAFEARVTADQAGAREGGGSADGAAAGATLRVAAEPAARPQPAPAVQAGDARTLGWLMAALVALAAAYVVMR